MYVGLAGCCNAAEQTLNIYFVWRELLWKTWWSSRCILLYYMEIRRTVWRFLSDKNKSINSWWAHLLRFLFFFRFCIFLLFINDLPSPIETLVAIFITLKSAPHCRLACGWGCQSEGWWASAYVKCHNWQAVGKQDLQTRILINNNTDQQPKNGSDL